MLHDAISTPVGRDEWIQDYIWNFKNSPTIDRQNNLELKRYQENEINTLS
jgi:hypothetical protein